MSTCNVKHWLHFRKEKEQTARRWDTLPHSPRTMGVRQSRYLTWSVPNSSSHCDCKAEVTVPACYTARLQQRIVHLERWQSQGHCSPRVTKHPGGGWTNPWGTCWGQPSTYIYLAGALLGWPPPEVTSHHTFLHILQWHSYPSAASCNPLQKPSHPLPCPASLLYNLSSAVTSWLCATGH